MCLKYCKERLPGAVGEVVDIKCENMGKERICLVERYDWRLKKELDKNICEVHLKERSRADEGQKK